LGGKRCRRKDERPDKKLVSSNPYFEFPKEERKKGYGQQNQCIGVGRSRAPTGVQQGIFGERPEGSRTKKVLLQPQKNGEWGADT